MNDINFITVATFTDHFLANHAVAKLHNNGIDAYLQNTERFLMENLDTIKLIVRNEDYERARDILEEEIEGIGDDNLFE